MYIILLFWNFSVILRIFNQIENKVQTIYQFSFEELQTSLNKAHDTAADPDDIHYQLLKHLPHWCRYL